MGIAGNASVAARQNTMGAAILPTSTPNLNSVSLNPAIGLAENLNNSRKTPALFACGLGAMDKPGAGHPHNISGAD